jgi:FixJ family two-component response regulator
MELICVVDDDESVRRSTKLLIESHGFRVATFESAEAFLTFEKLHDTSCLILDVQMPGINGLQLQAKLAHAGHSIPIVFITAYDDSQSRRHAMQAGATAFLDKPFTEGQLLQTIRSALQQGKSGKRIRPFKES